MWIQFCYLLLIISSLFFVISCHPASEQSSTGQLQQETAVEEAMHFRIDLQKSRVDWTGYKVKESYNGTVKLMEGLIAMNGDKISGGSFVVDMATIEATGLSAENNLKLTQALKGKDFFETDKYAQAKFDVVTIEPYLDNNKQVQTLQLNQSVSGTTADVRAIEGANYKITGTLAMKDSVKTISFPARILPDKNQLIAEAEFNINRSDWGIYYQLDESLREEMIFDIIHIHWLLTAIKE